MASDSDENKLLKRFLEHESSATVLYFRELRRLLRPEASTIGERLGEVFVRIGDEYQVRAGAHEQAAAVAGQLSRAVKVYEAIKEDLSDFSNEVADRPGITREFKEALQEPTFVGMIALEIAEDEDTPTNERIDHLFEQLEWIAIDAGDGLVVRDESSEEVVERLEETKRIDSSAKRIRDAVAEFAAQVSEKDELHKTLKSFLKSELAAIRIGSDYELSVSSPEEAVKALISNGIATGQDGKVRLRDEVSGEFVEHSREIMREFRTIMRKAKPIHRFAEIVTEADLRTALQSTAGKLVIATAIQQELAGQDFDGLSRWVERNFEQTPEGYVLRHEDHEMVQDFLRQMKEVEEELANDDF